MKIVNALALGMTAVLALVLVAQADDKKPDPKDGVTLKGTFVCTKCKLNETDECGTALQVKDKDDKVVTYYVDDEGKDAKYHDKFCTADVKGSVTGVVYDKDKKKHIKPAKDGVKFE